MNQRLMDTSGRDECADIVRGLAMLLVILGHTITGCFKNAEKSFLYNIIWSLQMPLFFLVSGYVTRYSRKQETPAQLWVFVKRRTTSYLLPWVVWTFLIRGFIFRNSHFFNVSWLINHMDAGYWFLFTIWTISMIFGFSAFFASKIAHFNEKKRNVLLLSFYCIGMGILAGIGYYMGTSFFGVRLTLYYMPFYYVGYLYSQLSGFFSSKRFSALIRDLVVAISLAVWLYIIVRIVLFDLPDGIGPALFRAMTSLFGAIAVCGLCKKMVDNWKGFSNARNCVAWIGVHSLEFYVAHYLFLSLVISDTSISISSVQGVFYWVVNYFVTVLLSYGFIQIINSNRILKFFLFGKKK